MEKVKTLFSGVATLMSANKKATAGTLVAAVLAAIATLNMTGKLDNWFSSVKDQASFVEETSLENPSPPLVGSLADIPVKDEPANTSTPEAALDAPPAKVEAPVKVTCPDELLTVTDSTGALKACVPDMGAAATL